MNQEIQGVRPAPDLRHIAACVHQQWLIGDIKPELMRMLAAAVAAIPAPEGAQLPPLPEPHWPRGYHGAVPSGGFTADQMHAYARAALAAPAPQAPVALTDEQVMQLFIELNVACVTAEGPSEMFAVIVRAIERAHGITQTKEPTNDR